MGVSEKPTSTINLDAIVVSDEQNRLDRGLRRYPVGGDNGSQ